MNDMEELDEQNLVKLDDGRVFTTSLIVAEAFGKEHKNVLQSIDNLECSEKFKELNFQPMVYEAKIGSGAKREFPAFELTRDGFMFLVMGFTGQKAAAWKEKFLEAFNAMEAKLFSQDTKQFSHPRRPVSTYRHIHFGYVGRRKICSPKTIQGLRGFIGFGAYLDEIDPAEIEARLASNFQVASLDSLAAMDARMAYALVERQVFRIQDDAPPATEEERRPLEALLDFGSYAECGQDRETLKNAIAYLCNLPSLDGLSAKGIRKALFILWAFLTRFPPMEKDILKACSGDD